MSCLKLEDLVCFYLRRKKNVQIPAIGREFEGGGLRKPEHIPQASNPCQSDRQTSCLLAPPRATGTPVPVLP